MADLGDVGYAIQIGLAPQVWAGTLSLSGIVNVTGDKARKIVLMLEMRGTPAIAHTISDASTGGYSFTGLSANYKYRITIIPNSETERGDVHNHLTPG